jgi:hypothetical protein
MMNPQHVAWYRTIAAACLLACAIPHTARAQEQGGKSFDATAGFSTVRGGGYTYHNEAGISLDLLLAVRRPAFRGFLRAVSAGIRVDFDTSDDCVVVPPSNTCLPNAPTIGHLGALVGYEVRRGGSSVRALVGPSYFSVPSGNSAGVRTQLSAAVGARHIALTGGVSGNLIAPFNSSALRFIAGTFGVRIQ